MINRLKAYVDHAQAEAGQAIVFVALFMILLVAMLGLAIDGGGLFFEWRSAQNAADSAVIAAAYARCAGDDIEQAKKRGLTVAAANGYTDDIGDEGFNEDEWQTNLAADTENPDVRIFFGDSGQTADITLRDGTTQAENAYVASQLPGDKDDPDTPRGNPDDFVYVDIYVEKPAYFIQVVYPYPLVVNPRAIAACNPGYDMSDIGGGFSWGDCNNALDWSASNVYYQGSLYSNADINVQSSQGGSTFNDSILQAAYDDPETTDVVEVGIKGEDKLRSRVTHPDVNSPAAIVPDGGTAPQTYLVQTGLGKIELEFLDVGDLENLYGPGGVFEAYLESKYGSGHGLYHSRTEDWTLKTDKQNPPDTLEGLYYVTGKVTITVDSEKDGAVTIGPKGATIIATDTIDVTINDGDSSDPTNAPHFQWTYFEDMMDEIPAEFTGGAYPDEQVFPGFLFVTLLEDTCTGSGSISVKGKVGDPNTVDFQKDALPVIRLVGVFYGPKAGIELGGTMQTYKASVIGRFIKYNMANGVFIHDPSLIPPMPARTRVAD